MKTLEWQRFLAQQKAQHTKVVFSVTELANVAQTTLHGLNTELGRLVKRGVLCRYAQGFYGLTEEVTPEQVLSAIDPAAYLTGFYALFRHHLVTQAPSDVTCFTNRRHNRKTHRATPAGDFRFMRVPAAIYTKPANQIVATPEQALCDFAWMSHRDDLDPRSLVTFRNLGSLSVRRLSKLLGRYPESVRDLVHSIVG